MTKGEGGTASADNFDLEERTGQFGQNAILFAKSIPHNAVSLPLISQFLRPATSIGANYVEADNAESKKDFRHKISISRKESRETKHWLRMIGTDEPSLKPQARTPWQEAHELCLIFSAILHR